MDDTPDEDPTQPGNDKLADPESGTASDDPAKSTGGLDAGKLLKFAGRILLGLAIFSVALIYMHLKSDCDDAGLVEIVKIGVLPLATLAISFYFQKAASN